MEQESKEDAMATFIGYVALISGICWLTSQFFRLINWIER